MLASPDPPALTSFQVWTFPPSTLTVVSFWLVAFDLLTLHIFQEIVRVFCETRHNRSPGRNQFDV